MRATLHPEGQDAERDTAPAEPRLVDLWVRGRIRDCLGWEEVQHQLKNQDLDPPRGPPPPAPWGSPGRSPRLPREADAPRDPPDRLTLRPQGAFRPRPEDPGPGSLRAQLFRDYDSKGLEGVQVALGAVLQAAMPVRALGPIPRRPLKQ